MEKLIHFLLPRESNNHKAKVLHSSSLVVIASFLIFVQLGLNFLPKIKPSILGYAASISRDEVVNLTNQRRIAAGLSPLTLNANLSNAAQLKGSDMIDRDYWAHVSPDGTQPWSFFKRVGYGYRYAGENLARDFSSASAAVDAWMNSPTHRDNILNPKYKEIGIGVVEGDLAGSDTTVIVQFFGATYADKPQQPLADKAANTTSSSASGQNVNVEPTQKPVTVAKVEPTQSPTVLPTIKPEELSTDIVIGSPAPSQQVLISPFTTTRNISISVVALLLVVFVVDAVLVSKRKIARIAGRTLAHVVFLGMILSIILILKSGNIM